MYLCTIYTLNLQIALEVFSANDQNVAQQSAGLSLMLMFSGDTGLKSQKQPENIGPAGTWCMYKQNQRNPQTLSDHSSCVLPPDVIYMEMFCKAKLVSDGVFSATAADSRPSQPPVL